MFRKFSIMIMAVLFSQTAISAPAPISDEEYRFLMALNVFGAPGVPPSKMRDVISVGCLDKEGNVVEPNTEKTIDGFELTCMVGSKSKDLDKSVHIWLPSRFAQHCKEFDSFEKCAGTANQNKQNSHIK